ncbi:MAG: alpha/beta hydrolase [Candidatus Omnitrophica bacterium]|nr:alpha/beta hydrolase [Candidatus Omnitrophota bacterium]
MIQSLIFSPDPHYSEYPVNYGLAWEDVSFQTPDKSELFGWYLSPSPPLPRGEREEPKGTILFFHGNAGNISGRLFKAEGWIKRGYSVLLYDYRSYGKSSGSIQSQEQMVEDGRQVLQWLTDEKQIPLSKIILYGESLGTHLAIRLGSEFKIAAVILEAPYTSFTDLAPVHYPWIPKSMIEAMLKHFSFPNQDFIGGLKAPLFILHGTKDLTCPFYMGEKIFEEALEPKELWSIAGGGHSDLPQITGKDYWDRPARFLAKYL